MTTEVKSVAVEPGSATPDRPESVETHLSSAGQGFDWLMTVLSGTFLGGLFLDGWAHTHGRVDDTFFTPWHAVLYSGYLVTALALVGRAAWDLARGAGWRQALPDGYGLALAGAGLWVIGGPFDLLWHTLFGFEASVEALMSPAHTVLALGLGLMASGPLRAALRRPPGRWHDELPLVLSLTFVVATLTFFTQIAHPISNLWAAATTLASADVTELGLVGTLLTAAIVTAPVLLLLRHGRLPAGAVAIFVGLQCFAMGFVYDRGPYPTLPVAGMIVAGAVVELLRVVLRPAVSRPAAFRWFAFALPVLLYAGYFGALGLAGGIRWSTHLWTGAVVFSGIIGWLISYLVLPPRLQPGR
ncbi:MAG TPA: hypothetical protein VFO18_12550 [Methylomirabilota bacterium]|nr:hypothetical protein [Methylomirabilota bacterium]